MLHGFCEDHTIWANMLPALRHCDVYVVDLPGFGKSHDGLPDDLSIDWVAETVHRELISANQLQPLIAGHSLGGYVALALAEKHQRDTTGLCLFHSTCFADSPEKKETRNKVIDFVSGKGVEAYTSQFVPGLFHSTFRRSHAKEVEKVVALASTTPLATLTQYTAAMRDRPDRSEVLSAFPGRKLIIAGEKDGAVPLEQSIKMSKMVGQGAFILLKSTAHMGMFERPEACRKALADWA